METTETYFYLTQSSPKEIVFTQNRLHSYYKIIDDTLFRTGNETSQKKLSFVNSEPVFILIITGDSLQCNFNGKKEYGGFFVPLSLNGTAKTIICTIGWLLLLDDVMIAHHRIINETAQPERHIVEKSQYWIKPPSYLHIVENTLTQINGQTDTMQHTHTYFYPQASMTGFNRNTDSLSVKRNLAINDSVYMDATSLPNPVIA